MFITLLLCCVLVSQSCEADARGGMKIEMMRRPRGPGSRCVYKQTHVRGQDVCDACSQPAASSKVAAPDR